MNIATTSPINITNAMVDAGVVALLLPTVKPCAPSYWEDRVRAVLEAALAAGTQASGIERHCDCMGCVCVEPARAQRDEALMVAA